MGYDGGVSRDHRHKRPAGDPARGPRPADATVRQQLTEQLRAGEVTFDELRRELRLSVRALEEHLRHIERSARQQGHRFEVAPAACRRCDYVFEHRAERHLHRPGRCPECRCPECRSERITSPRLRLVIRSVGAAAD